MISVSPRKLLEPQVKLDLNNLSPEQVALEIKNLNLYYGEKQALQNISMSIPKGQVTAFIGPSGCGKSTLLRCINRMNDLVDTCKIEGEINLHGENIYGKQVDVAALRRQVGMVFQRPNPFPKSIYENVVYGLRIMGENNRRVLDEAAEKALRNDFSAASSNTRRLFSPIMRKP
jgi:phosphate transport system ATP-binding protein